MNAAGAAKEKAVAAANKTQAAVGNVVERAKVIVFGEVENNVHTPTLLNQVLVAMLVISVFMLVVSLIKLIYTNIKSMGQDSPWLIDGMHDAKHAQIITQNPNDKDAVPLRRSLNEQQGLEFSYLTWIFVEDYEYKKGAWKHVFHKGSKTSYPNRAPGVWLHPSTNVMRVYMNTYSNISTNYIDIPNIPISKWFQFTLIVRETTMDVFINGYLKKRIMLQGIPKQNFGDLYITNFGGFGGYISRMRYYDYAIKYSQIDSHLGNGPSTTLPESSRQKPPYLTPQWWYNSPNPD